MTDEKKTPMVHRAPNAPMPAPAPPDRPDLVKSSRFIMGLVDQGYFGKLTLSFQNGKIVDVRTEQVMKITDL